MNCKNCGVELNDENSFTSLRLMKKLDSCKHCYYKMRGRKISAGTIPGKRRETIDNEIYERNLKKQLRTNKDDIPKLKKYLDSLEDYDVHELKHFCSIIGGGKIVKVNRMYFNVEDVIDAIENNY